MPLPTRAIGAVHYAGVGNFLGTCAEMALPVALAAWLTRLLLPRSRRGLAFVLASLAIAFVGGGAALARFALSAASTRPEAAPAATAPTTAPEPSAAPVPAPAVNPPSQLAPDAVAEARADDPDPEHRGWEELERRHQMAERLRRLIAAGKNATGPAQMSGPLAVGKPTPVYRDENLVGIALQEVPEDSVYAHLGLRDGDTVTSINGVPFDSPDAGSALIGALSEPQLELSVLRGDGTVQQLAVPREQLIKELRAFE
jgi:hypothetical protein